ncbi:antibiotic biosynthesis monooxygenase [Halobaculum marinum]|uniref:Antibiotic biosynthesis monooxygenase n=1 Tax=Halobaculum marinum TaxID=3031996 RepID=A0ABD5X3V8_9EURY|nr:antibiotic biosynthesis monooxygenase [Halobaculum sp. DT55]
MVYLLARANVADVDAWQTAFDANDDYRTEHGQRGYQVFRPRDAHDEVVVLFEWDDERSPVEFFDSPGMRERMREAGVQGRPEMTLADEVTRTAPAGPSA